MGSKYLTRFWYSQNSPSSGSLTLVSIDYLMLSTGIQALGLLVKMYILKETKKKSCHVLMYCRIYRDHYMHSVYFFTLFPYSILQATVHILPEVNLPSHPEGALWSCCHKFGCQATTAGSLEKPYQVSSGKNRLGKTRYRKVSF